MEPVTALPDRRTSLGLKSLPDICSVLAIVATPLVHIYVPKPWLAKPLALGLDVKDWIASAAILFLAGLILFGRFASRIRRLTYFNPFYESVEHSFFYQEDGTFTLRSLYVLNSGWKSGLRDLPAEGFLWFNKIPRDKLHYRLIQYGSRRDRHLSAERPIIGAVQFQSPREGERETALLTWRPRIDPPMKRFETLAYQVEVTTPYTETAAFHSDGTILGFPVILRTIYIKLRAFAPQGFAFRLQSPIASVRSVETAEELAWRTPKYFMPRLSVDESVLLINGWNPKKHARYWSHFRFEEVSKSPS